MRFTFSAMIVAALAAVAILVIADKGGLLRHPQPIVTAEAPPPTRSASPAAPPPASSAVPAAAASDPDFNYSNAMRQAHIVWYSEKFDAYLADPQKVAPGNRMPFPGLKSDHDRTDLIRLDWKLIVRHSFP